MAITSSLVQKLVGKFQENNWREKPQDSWKDDTKECDSSLGEVI